MCAVRPRAEPRGLAASAPPGDLPSRRRARAPAGGSPPGRRDRLPRRRAIGRRLIGPSSINWALGFVPAAVVAIAILGEPIGATLIAATLPDEVPTLREWAGRAVPLPAAHLGLRGPVAAVCRRRAPGAEGGFQGRVGGHGGGGSRTAGGPPGLLGWGR